MIQQQFNDGVVKICAVVSKKAEPKYDLRYKERTVGFARYYAAKQIKANIKYVLRCQRIRNVTTRDIAIPNDGKQHKIVQIQYPEDIAPPVMDLTLEELDCEYELGGAL